MDFEDLFVCPECGDTLTAAWCCPSCPRSFGQADGIPDLEEAYELMQDSPARLERAWCTVALGSAKRRAGMRSSTGRGSIHRRSIGSRGTSPRADGRRMDDVELEPAYLWAEVVLLQQLGQNYSFFGHRVLSRASG